jgi:hypothetical protein
MLKDDGLFVLTCATYGRREHGTPRRSMDSSLTSETEGGSYYLNLAMQDIVAAIPVDQMFSDYRFFYNHFSRDFYFIGFKSSAANVKSEAIAKFAASVKSIKRDRAVGFAEDFFKKLKFQILYLLTKLIGDKAYQDFRYALSSKSKSK